MMSESTDQKVCPNFCEIIKMVSKPCQLIKILFGDATVSQLLSA
jgi:hypothetical protein